MKIKCVVACRDAGGTPALYPCVVEVTQDEYNNGDHYDTAREMAEDEGYEADWSSLVFDQNDGPAFLFEHLFP